MDGTRLPVCAFSQGVLPYGPLSGLQDAGWLLIAPAAAVAEHHHSSTVWKVHAHASECRGSELNNVTHSKAGRVATRKLDVRK